MNHKNYSKLFFTVFSTFWLTVAGVSAEKQFPVITDITLKVPDQDIKKLNDFIFTVRENIDILNLSTKENQFILNTLENAEKYIKNKAYVKALRHLAVPEFRRLIGNISAIKKIRRGDLAYRTITFQRSGLSWKNHKLITGEHLVVTCFDMKKQNKYYRSIQRSWGPNIIELDQDNMLEWGPVLRQGTFNFYQKLELNNNKASWTICCTIPFQATQRPNRTKTQDWNWFDLDFFSNSGFFWNCHADIIFQDGSKKSIQIPELNQEKPWQKIFRNTAAITFHIKKHIFRFSVCPEGQTAELYPGMTVVGDTIRGWIFNVSYTPKGKTWQAGTQCRFIAEMEVTDKK